MPFVAAAPTPRPPPGSRIGALCEGLCERIVELEASAELTAEKADIFHRYVRRRVAGPVDEAWRACERSLEVGWSSRGATRSAAVGARHRAPADLELETTL